MSLVRGSSIFFCFFNHCAFLSYEIFIYLYIFLDRGKRREKERKRNITVREKHRWVASRMRPDRGQSHTQDMCPDQELNRWPFALQDGTQPSHTGQGTTAYVEIPSFNQAPCEMSLFIILVFFSLNVALLNKESYTFWVCLLGTQSWRFSLLSLAWCINTYSGVKFIKMHLSSHTTEDAHTDPLLG